MQGGLKPAGLKRAIKKGGNNAILYLQPRQGNKEGSVIQQRKLSKKEWEK